MTLSRLRSVMLAFAAVLAMGSVIASGAQAKTVKCVKGRGEGCGSVQGTVSNNAMPPEGVAGARVAVCLLGGHPCVQTETNSQGFYEVGGLSPGTYLAVVYPPNGLKDEETRAGPFAVTQGKETVVNLTLSAPIPPPPGTHVRGVREQEGIPVVNWHQEAEIETEACIGGTVTVTLTLTNSQTGATETTSPRTLTESPSGSGKFVGLLPAVYPDHGAGTDKITVTGCENPEEDKTSELSEYHDPSGVVVNGDDADAPIAGAEVTLLSSETRHGPFTMVPNGSNVMSPLNRENSMTSNGAGEFGWDTLSGFYEVTASKAGCGSATTPAFEVPPPQTELRIVLYCEEPLAIETKTLPEATRGEPYESQLEATGGRQPYKKWKAKGLPKGLKLSKTGLLSGTLSIKLTPGTYPFAVSVSDSAKHTAETTLTLTVH